MLIPILIGVCPTRPTTGRFDNAFIEARRLNLESFLNKISTHQVLSKSVHFAMFLIGNDEVFTQAKHDSDSPTNSLRKRTVLELISVKDPVKVGVLQPYIQYTVSSSRFLNEPTTAVRRFSDFAWLHDGLEIEHEVSSIIACSMYYLNNTTSY